MPLQLTSLLKVGVLPKTAFAINHLKDNHLEVSKDYSALSTSFKKTLDALKTQLIAGEENQLLDPKGTTLRVVVLKNFTTKSTRKSSKPKEDIYFLLTNEDEKALEKQLKFFVDKYLKKKNEFVMVLDLVYAGTKGGKYFFEALKGDTLINIANAIKALNTISKTKGIRIVGKGKANVAAQEIEAVLSDWDLLVKRFEEENELIASVYPEDEGTIPNVKQLLFQLELPIKKMHRTLKRVIEESTQDESPEKPQAALAMKQTYADWLAKFKALKAKVTNGSKVELKLKGELDKLEQDRARIAQTVYTEVEVLDLLAKYQLIKSIPAYKAILVNKEKKELIKLFIEIGKQLKQMVQNEAVMRRLLEMLNFENTMLEEIGQEVQQLWDRFTKSVNETVSFQQIQEGDLVQLKGDVESLIKKLQLQARGLIQATKYLDDSEMTALDVSRELSLFRSSIRNLKEAIEAEVAVLQQRSVEMYQLSNSLDLAYENTSIPREERRTLGAGMLNDLRQMVDSFNQQLSQFKPIQLLRGFLG